MNFLSTFQKTYMSAQSMKYASVASVPHIRPTAHAATPRIPQRAHAQTLAPATSFKFRLAHSLLQSRYSLSLVSGAADHLARHISRRHKPPSSPHIPSPLLDSQLPRARPAFSERMNKRKAMLEALQRIHNRKKHKLRVVRATPQPEDVAAKVTFNILLLLFLSGSCVNYVGCDLRVTNLCVLGA